MRKKNLFIFLSFQSEDLFYKSFLISQYILSNKIKAIILIDIFATRFGFINEKSTKIIN